MPVYAADSIWVTSTTMGLTTFTLGAALPSYRSFSAAGVPDGSIIHYSARTPSEFENGEGIYASGSNSLSRVTIFASSNANAKVNFGALPTIAITPLAEDAIFPPAFSTDNRAVRWDGTGGDAVQNSSVDLPDSGAIGTNVVGSATVFEQTDGSTSNQIKIAQNATTRIYEFWVNPDGSGYGARYVMGLGAGGVVYINGAGISAPGSNYLVRINTTAGPSASVPAGVIFTNINATNDYGTYLATYWYNGDASIMQSLGHRFGGVDTDFLQLRKGTAIGFPSGGLVSTVRFTVGIAGNYPSVGDITIKQGGNSQVSAGSNIGGLVTYRADNSDYTQVFTGGDGVTYLVNSTGNGFSLANASLVAAPVNVGSLVIGGVPTFANIPQIIQNVNYTIVATDGQKHIVHSSGSAHTWTIPANAAVAFPIGTCITFYNHQGGGVVTIGINTDTLYLAGAANTTGNRTLTAVGIATALKIASTQWVISGTGLT